MFYVAYNLATARVILTTQSARAAAGSATKARKRTGIAHSSSTQEWYDVNVNTWTTTYNMLDPTRKPIAIRKADLGGCCDPATERYHSM